MHDGTRKNSLNQRPLGANSEHIATIIGILLIMSRNNIYNFDII